MLLGLFGRLLGNLALELFQELLPARAPPDHGTIAKTDEREQQASSNE